MRNSARFDVAIALPKDSRSLALQNIAGDTYDLFNNVMRMSNHLLPQPGSQILLGRTRAEELAAAAALTNRALGRRVDTELLDVLRTRRSVADLEPGSRLADSLFAVRSLMATDKLSLHSRVSLLGQILDGSLSKSTLPAALNRALLSRMMANAPLAKGVDATEQAIGKPATIGFNPDAVPHYSFHLINGADTGRLGAPMTTKVGNAIVEALELPASQLPSRGAIIGSLNQTPETITAMAILTSRAKGLPVDENLARIIASHDSLKLAEAVREPLNTPSGIILNLATDNHLTLQQKTDAIATLLSGVAVTKPNVQALIAAMPSRYDPKPLHGFQSAQPVLGDKLYSIEFRRPVRGEIWAVNKRLLPHDVHFPRPAIVVADHGLVDGTVSAIPLSSMKQKRDSVLVPGEWLKRNKDSYALIRHQGEVERQFLIGQMRRLNETQLEQLFSKAAN